MLIPELRGFEIKPPYDSSWLWHQTNQYGPRKTVVEQLKAMNLCPQCGEQHQ
jgi:hypothetical protein